MSTKEDLVKDFRSQQEKYVYYIVALCVTSLAYTVAITKDMKISICMVPLGLSIIAWLVSIYCGLTLVKTLLHHTYLNLELLERKENKEVDIDDIRKLISEAKKLQKKAISLGDVREYSFYIGIASFVVWRIIEMA